MSMKCEHLPEHAVLTLTPELIHHGKWCCGQCGSFLGWQAKPANVEKVALNEKKIAHCRNGNGLTEWEKTFSGSLDARRVSPKQQVILDRICNQTGFAP